MKKYLPYVAGIVIALTWGFSFMFTRGMLDYLHPFHLLGLRFAIGLGTMSLLRVVRLIKIRLILNDFKYLLPLTIFQPILYFTSETMGVLLTSASYSGMMIAVIPIFVAILSSLVLKEHPSRLQLIFIITSVAGVIFIIFLDNRSITGVNPIGTIALLGAVISGASYSIASRKASVRYTPVEITWVMMVVGALVFNSLAIFNHIVNGNLNNYLWPLSELWLPLIYLGLFSSVVAFFMFNYMLSKITATQASVFANMVTVVAIASGVGFRGEPLYWHHLVGTAAILAGVWGTNRFASKQ